VSAAGSAAGAVKEPGATVKEPAAVSTRDTERTGRRTIVAFCCRECAYAAADAAANARTPLHMLEALAEGADGAMLAGCLEGQCHYREGNFNAIDRVKFVQRMLDSVGVEPERVRMFTMSAGEPPKFVAAVREMDRTICALPPLERS
jgi:coenzyme F420-reducing hydrogenase delta subunit